MPLDQHHTQPTVPLVMVDHFGLLHAKDNFLSPEKNKIISVKLLKKSKIKEIERKKHERKYLKNSLTG